ncbi:hypothetical protein QN360_19470, partial [Glaciimonas sp. CA11.2]|uniref:hypothetical protein n=1 Tax=Glaciimonas sp. CA11.2 TaxID=3048601 RepID=UPI002B236E38
TFVAPFWGAMVGRLRPAGCFGYWSANPAICRPPRLAAGRGFILSKESAMSRTTTSNLAHPQFVTAAQS